MNRTWVILGATSSIARSFVQLLAERGDGLILAGRDIEDLTICAADARARGAKSCEIAEIDMRKPATFAPVLELLSSSLDELGAAVFTGSMPEQDEIDADPAILDGVVQDNYSGPAQFLLALAPVMETRGTGVIVGVGSVAGDRGRLGNYVYGSAKAGFATFLSGLRNRLARSGVHVVTVKPGMIDTAMTWHLDKLMFPGTPVSVSRDILRAVEKRRNEIYSPRIWTLIMMVIRNIPEAIFKKMSI